MDFEVFYPGAGKFLLKNLWKSWWWTPQWRIKVPFLWPSFLLEIMKDSCIDKAVGGKCKKKQVVW